MATENFIQQILSSLNSVSWVSFLLSICFIRICYAVLQWYHAWSIEDAFRRSHNCQLPPQLPNYWPLGINWIKKLWDTNAEGRLLPFISTLADEYEPRNCLYQFLLFGPRNFHAVHPDNVEACQSTNFKDYSFGMRRSVFAPLLGNGIFTQEGADWKHSRELLRKQFVRTQYKNLDHFQEHADNLIANIPEHGEVDLQPLFFNLTLDSATALLFGRSVYSLRANIDQGEENRQFAQSFNIAQEGLAKRFRLAPLHFLYNPREFREACQNVHRFVEKYIQERSLKEKEDTEDSASWFFDQVAADSDSETDLRDQLLNVLLAGRDTTACCLSWTFRLLVRYPEAMKRLRAEVASVMGDSSIPTRAQIQQMPFLACVLKESLRLYPPVPLNNREAIRTTILPTGGGPDGTNPILVRKGEIVVFSQYVTSRRRNIYGEDAHEFRPERWESSEVANIGWAFNPFNGGPRKCLGEDFALMQISYTIVRLLQTFPSIKLPGGEKLKHIGDERQQLTLVLSCADGCRVMISQDSEHGD